MATVCMYCNVATQPKKEGLLQGFTRGAAFIIEGAAPEASSRR